MKIENLQYHNDNLGTQVAIKATINGSQVFVPFDPSNIHYDEIMKRVKEGTLTIKDAD